MRWVKILHQLGSNEFEDIKRKRDTIMQFLVTTTLLGS